MANTTNFNWETPDDTDLVKDGAAAIRTLGNSIDTSFVDLKGGTTGQVLSKATNTDLDYSWITPTSGISATIVDAKGDLIAATAADTVARLAVGTNGQVLQADSTTATGLKWATPAAGGKLLQVVSATTTTSTSVTSTSYADITGITASITPSATTSKILVMFYSEYYGNCSNDDKLPQAYFRILRGATDLFAGSDGRVLNMESSATGGNQRNFTNSFANFYLDSPSTTSAITYKYQSRLNVTTSMTFSWYSPAATIILAEIGA